MPSGRYIVHDTIRLKPDTVLIGLHPSITADRHCPTTRRGFGGVGTPKALLETPARRRQYRHPASACSPAASIRARWRPCGSPGAHSLMNDVRFLGGHGTNNPDGSRSNPYNDTHTADPDIHRRWDGQYPSLWVTNGGGGTFSNIWTPSTFAQAGLYISDTTTPGRVYEISSEHHVRTEVQLDRVENWEIIALQTEEERGESGFALPLEISRSRNITVANYHGYRVISSYQPFPTAARVSNSPNIRFRNVHVQQQRHDSMR